MNQWFEKECHSPCQVSADNAQKRQATLTKPMGSLGKLEELAVKFSAWQQTDTPEIKHIMVRVFAGDHGICHQNVSAFPQEVTMQMVLNFINGGAAISVLSEAEQANFAVVNMGLSTPLPHADDVLQHPQLINIDLGPGTADFSHSEAMTDTQVKQALTTGKEITSSYLSQHNTIDLFIGGDMGIGNTSSASAIYCSLLGISPTQACGPGTGIDSAGVSRKARIIERALTLHKLDYYSDKSTHSNDINAYDVLRKVGGFEIAALAGTYIAMAQHKIPSLVDGFISTAAALIAVNLNPSCRDWLLFSHQSAEPAHTIALHHLQAQPLLNIGMRLGEGSGAAICIPLLRSALTLHNNMATFEEAAIAGKKQ
ncbi:MAG: nicotinate-nucleotide--dimethylbenzimidazole phosphoribosyltransferase [Arenicella sp.]